MKDQHDVERLAQLILEYTGNVIPEGQYPHLQQATLRHARDCGFSTLDPYLELLSGPDSEPEWRELLPDITIKESFLFRIPEQFKALQNEILPQLARIRPADHTLRVWSAGCARGEEPATLAMVLEECRFLAHRQWEIIATDIDAEALKEARRGQYGARAMAQVPPHLARAWFTEKNGVHTFSPELQRHIKLSPFNFFHSPYLSLGVKFDLILLRNVLIYFTPEAQKQVLERVTACLAPDGYLFLGHSESLFHLSDDMEAVEFDNCFAYRRRLTPKPSVRPTPKRSPPSLAALAPTAPPHEPDLATPPIPPAIDATVPPATTPSTPGVKTDERLVQAAQAMLEDRLEESRGLIETCLRESKDVADVHALSGLLHDLLGNLDDAIQGYRAALFLQPNLYQIRFLLAHRFEHKDMPARARNEYQRVLTDLGNGQGRELSPPLGGATGLLQRLLPPGEATSLRSRRALDRL